jgi:hypothetical protein
MLPVPNATAYNVVECITVLKSMETLLKGKAQYS